MRIARVVTVCVALVSTLLGVETERFKRRPQPKDHLPQPRAAGGNPSPITFTTLRPITSFNHQIEPNLHPAVNRRTQRLRTSRFALIKIRESNDPKNNPHRRQLLRRGKKNHLGRSYDASDAHKIETLHVSPEVVHLEPVYRMTKNKNIFDSIIDLIRRIIGTEKTVGPLVGPFSFPGMGDKVYVRLLEPAPSDHLVIRLVTHSPVTEVVKEVSAPIEIPQHPEVPSPFNHETVVVSSDDLTNSFNQHNAISSVESDSLLSSSNNLVQTLKSSSHLGEKVVANGPYVSRTHRMNVNSTNQPLSMSNQFDWSFVDRFNDSIKDQRTNDYQDSFNQVYQFYPPLNESSHEDFGPLNINVQEFPDTFNVSDFQQIGPIIPYRDYSLENQHEFKNEFVEPTEGPKYSLDFVSKKMRYLNMDGSVDSSSETEDKDFKSVKRGPVLPKLARSVDNRKRVARRLLVRKKEAARGGVREKNGGSEEFPEVYRKSKDDGLNYSRNVFGNSTRLNENGNQNDRKEYLSNFSERQRNGSRSVLNEESTWNSREWRGI